jgi:hypothetical protein
MQEERRAQPTRATTPFCRTPPRPLHTPTPRALLLHNTNINGAPAVRARVSRNERRRWADAVAQVLVDAPPPASGSRLAYARLPVCARVRKLIDAGQSVVDCAEGTYNQLRKPPLEPRVQPRDVRKMFVTHMHGENAPCAFLGRWLMRVGSGSRHGHHPTHIEDHARSAAAAGRCL